MSSHLLIETTGQVVLIAATVSVAATARALASVLRTWIEQASRTRRLARALEDSRPNQRPEIIVACSQLEGKPAGRPRVAAAGEGIPADGPLRPTVVIPLDKRGLEHHAE
jgi:hypothetical protein